MNDSHHNPYSPPTTIDLEVASNIEYPRLASRVLRLGATLLDNIFVVVAVLPVLLSEPFRDLMLASEDDEIGEFAVEQMDLILLGVTVILGIGLLIWNLILLDRNGQTLGKLCCGIKIVRTDYTKASFSRVFWLRAVVNALFTAIPVVGNIYALVDVLFIFGEERKCIHDMFADTIVVYKS